ncbi:hypothetical protein SCHPADRAFT_76216 [Schizopora paradoxa]|uniref:Uncharacterized protein n=1 Tax=Schizopora paradoxa TaxID=27342 RepID=A0A0H2S5E7_9AGAM|nr:hypothetical protein SCHPADRAFT_76216 [Schizopora paradoxa]
MSSTSVDDNDPRFTYKSTWVSGGLPEEFGETHHATDTPGAQMVFGPFSGTSISVFGTIGDVKIPSVSTPQFRQLLYEASNLDASTPHTLQINQLDPGSFTLDFVEIGSPSSSTPTSETPSPTTTTTTTSESSSQSPNASIAVTSTNPIATVTVIGPVAPSSRSDSATQTNSALAVPSMASATSSGSQNEPSPSSQPSPFTSNRTFIAVICSAIGGFLLILIIAAALVLYVRRRHKSQRPKRNPTTSSTNTQLSPLSRSRPSLRLRIPDFPVPSRDPGTSSSILPMYSHAAAGASADLSSTTKQAPQIDLENRSQEDSNSGPIFDIKQRPVSGTTMTTRVTVGTNIGSIPDEPLPERVPAVPSFPPELVLADISSTPSSGSDSFSASWTNYSFNAGGTYSTRASAPSNHTSWIVPRRSSPVPPLPSLPTLRPMVHSDAGLRLDSSLPSVSPLRIDLPPPYQNFL